MRRPLITGPTLGRPFLSPPIMEQPGEQAIEGFPIDWAMNHVAQDPTFICAASARTVMGYVGNPSAANPRRLITGIPAHVQAIHGGRWVSADNLFYTTDTAGNTLNPYILKSTSSGVVKVFTSYATYSAGAVVAGEQVAILTSAGNRVYMTALATDTAVSVTVTDADIGSNVADAGGFNWRVGGYATGLATQLEAAGENLQIQSEDRATSWDLAGVTISINSAVAPDGETTADSTVEEATNAIHRLSQTKSIISSVDTYCYSDWVKVGSERYPQLGISISAGDYVSLIFDIDTLTTHSAQEVVGSIAASGFGPLINGYRRIWLAYTPGSASAARVGYTGMSDSTTPAFASRGSATYLGVITKSNEVWGAQLELGDFPTSYTPTTTTSLARAATLFSDTTAGRLSAESGAGRIIVNLSEVDGTGTILSTQVDADNWLDILIDGSNVFLRKRIAGSSAGNRSLSGAAVLASDDYAIVDFYYNSSGMGIRAFLVGANVPSFTPGANTETAQIASTFELGTRSGGGIAQSGNYISAELSINKGDLNFE